jgi:hypothetical protein
VLRARHDWPIARQARALRTALPGWGVLYNPFAHVWMACRGRYGPVIGSTTPAGLLRQIEREGMAMRQSDALMRACRELALYALCQGNGVRVWLRSLAGPWPIPEAALLVLPGYDPQDGGETWLWEQGERRGRHERGDIAGTAVAVAEFLRGQMEQADE